MAQQSILVVDDDATVRQLLTVVLASPDRRIDAASDGREALARIESTPYDLVLTDLRMPGMDGSELLRRIREASPRTKVIVMTAGSTPASVVQSLRDQAFAYFSKPFSQAFVAHMISQALRAASWEDDIEVLSAQPEWISLAVRCRLGTAERLIQFLREMEVRLTAGQRDEIAMAFHELLVNAIEHGGQCDPEKRLRLTYIRTSRAVLYHIADPGPGFSIEELPHAAVSNPPGEPYQHVYEREQRGMRPGGFGILLARHLVDELIYNETGNEVLLIKYVADSL
ncbi:MAG: response regulator [Bryobacteraceae bacterium]|jgi:CheY-like chemotaxis protein/anti-sigma regulatory factor (Ser/Thr protein kinase)